jgi:prepilin-type processing-associated H-X9-DG protein
MRTRMQPSAKSSAFSLVELLTVMAIIILVTALVLPALMSAREKARKGKCAAHMGQYGVAFRLYQNDHKGMYPDPWVNNSDNWQSFLCGAIPFDPWVGPNVYVPSEWATYSGAPIFAKRINGKFLCPTICKRYNIPDEGVHDQWGYTINATRIEISYQALGGEWPWFKPEYIGADLDAVYPSSGISAVMCCGNTASWNSDNNWNAFTSADINDWVVIPIHGDVVNTLFMDGHVEGIDITMTEGQNEFNHFWYNGIPSTMGNPW